MGTTRVGLRRIGPDGLATFALSNLLILATGGLSWLLLWTHALRWSRRLRCPGRGRCILVLGQQLEAGVPGPGYRLRLLRAARLARRNPEARILVLGGQTSPEGPTEAAAGAAFLRRRGIASERIQTEDASRHTLENLRNARDLLAREPHDDEPLVLITSRFHLARSAAMARGMGLHVCPCPAELGSRVSAARLAREAWMLHWYHVGRGFARLIRHRGMLERIS
ncbi:MULTISPECIES: YdcF family protein [unclassified Thioalkalivibrio]|uniref:YdcF family protein n=1 Tax=unclassified Thioalkalivibrio TaxID=2621013 RepID=UPI00037A46B5|nr:MULTISPECIES: YdcF family protein [unclassified Thioalkalivibrio]